MAQEPITTYCPACGKSFRVPPDLQGKKILCKTCQTHFVVQADRPGIPAAAPPAPAPAAPRPAHGAAPTPLAAAPGSPVATAGHATSAPSTPAKVLSAPASHPPVTHATTAPIAVPPPATDALAPIPFDDSPIQVSADGAPGAAAPTVGRPAVLEKVKIESKGPYYVIKLVTAGKMIHVNIENALNEHAVDGWRLEQIVTVSGDSYAILSRFNSHNVPSGNAQGGTVA